MSIAEVLFNAADASGSGTTSADSLVAQFKTMDASGTGTLSMQAWVDGLRQAGFSDEAKAKAVFSKLDKSGGGVPLTSLNAIPLDAAQGGTVTKADFLEAAKKGDAFILPNCFIPSCLQSINNRVNFASS